MAIVKLETIAPKFLISEIEASSNDDCIPCMLTSREVTVIRQALFPAAYWRTRLGEDVGVGRFFYTENETVKTDFRNLVDGLDYKLSGGPAMDCFESVKEGLEAIAQSIAGFRCCNADVSDISVSVTPGGNPVTGDITQGVANEGEGDPPEGFTDWEEYFLHKCRAANAIVDGFINQLNTFSIMTVISFVSVSAALGIFLAMSFPPAGIAMLIVALAVLVEARIYLGQLSDYIAANRADFVCAIYDSDTAGEAIDYFLTQIDSGIEYLGLTAPLPGELRAVVNALCDANVFAKVYDAGFEVFYPDADCSQCASAIECEPEDHWGHNQNAYTQISENVWEVVADLTSGYHINTGFIGDYTRVIESIEVISGTAGIVTGSYCGFYQCVDGEYVGTFYFSEPGNSGQTLIEHLNAELPARVEYIYAAYGGGPYTVRITLSGDCGECISEGDSMAQPLTLSEFRADLVSKGIVKTGSWVYKDWQDSTEGGA